MENKNILILLFVFFCQNILASPSDSLVRFGDLSFKNEVEKSAFKKLALTKDSTDILDLFLTPFNGDNGFSSGKAREKIDACVISLQKEINNKTGVKKIKLIYKHVHHTFFKVYKLKNSFSDIFEKGEYNCVSATALYAIIYSKLGISYQIKETPTHIYLVANPTTDKVLIETTNPEKGYYQFNNNYIETYVKSLADSKTITKQELDTTDVHTLFNKYHFASESISLLQLSGLQYSNFGIFNFEDKNYEAANSEIKKACYLFPSARTKYLLKSSLAYQVSSNNYDNQKQIDNLVLLCRFNNLKDSEVSNQLIKNEFLRIIQAQLIDNSNYEKFDESFRLISNALKDTTLKNDIAFDYHYELARLGYVNARDNAYEIKHLQAAYKINPRNANLQVITMGYFGQTADKNKDPKVVLNLIKQYGSIFDFMNDKKELNSVKANCLLELSYRCYSINDLVQGENYLKEFENLCELKKSTEPLSEYVERAYSVAAAMFYKKGNYTKSKQLLKTGLIYYPDSFGLRQRLNQL